MIRLQIYVDLLVKDSHVHRAHLLNFTYTVTLHLSVLSCPLSSSADARAEHDYRGLVTFVSVLGIRIRVFLGFSNPSDVRIRLRTLPFSQNLLSGLK
jgi:hypothetical protein